MKNTIQNTSAPSTSSRTAFGARRFVIGAASVVAAGALIGVGAQGAFAATGDTGASGSGSASATASTPFGGASAGGAASFSGGTHGSSLAGQAHALFNGHVNGEKAQQLAKRIVADGAVFSLLPDSLQGDLKSLAGASAQDRTADAKKIVSTALSGGYGSAIQKLATQLKGSEAADGKNDDALSGLDVKGLDVKGLLQGLRSGDLLSSGSGAASQLGADAAGIASTVTGDSELASKLPDSLRNDLSELATAPAAARTADVQRIATTALSGGYGAQIQQVADQVEQTVTAAH
ncbi:hypothetical protein ASF88_19050 [Leifsonia sp. Leaf336]|uniref:hypothetical protein n=1 Tax=Leifsonia sp. Leaf336 TaxID=1736341 RepID=UPI0006FC050B|nr:hypothetical protein [Leifsonia sp. Leaf336]KQR51267.1 hypothetical protein ASF88_19050 [Leifsonia sp. Leaf336]